MSMFFLPFRKRYAMWYRTARKIKSFHMGTFVLCLKNSSLRETGKRQKRWSIMSVQGETRERTRIHVREPRSYRVVMHNDDFTPMDFVVEILMDIFHKDALEAERLMLTVHESGRAAVGAYPYDIAVTKVQTSLARAKEEGYPFRMTVEET